MAFEWEWLRGDLDDPVDVKTFAALRIVLNGQIATRLYDQIAGGQRDAVHVALYPLALFIAENWWPLLNEPRKSDEDDSYAEIRHSLDAYMRGFVFPALTVWSGGGDAITVETPDFRQQFSDLEFLHPQAQVSNLLRTEVEEDLYTLLAAVVDRVPRRGPGTPLHEAWDRVLGSLEDDEERRYCVSAGKLGIDPYHPDALDITELADGLSEHLFSDICEAATPDELPAAVEWAREGHHHSGAFPEVDIRAFGPVTVKDPRSKVYDHGYEVARIVRQNLGLEGLNPRRTVDRFFGAAVRADAHGIVGARPLALEGVAIRSDSTMRVLIPKVSARLRRSTLCRASYLAWRTADGDSSAVTTATTLDQQASRAFAAEMLAPAEFLKGRAGPNGLTPNDVVTIASENVCPEATVIWQAHNHGIPLRGISLPARHVT
jgi:hypothetical protein